MKNNSICLIELLWRVKEFIHKKQLGDWHSMSTKWTFTLLLLSKRKNEIGMGAVQTYARQAWGIQATYMGTERTLHSLLWNVECLACVWVMLTKSAISKVDRWFCFSVLNLQSITPVVIWPTIDSMLNQMT